MTDEQRRTSDGPPDDGFDYGDRREDGQFENHPTTDEGEFVQPVRSRYVHVEACGATTRMGTDLAESFARDPEQYGKTFCAECSDYYPLDEFVWKETEIRLDEVGVVADHEDAPDGVDEDSGGDEADAVKDLYQSLNDLRRDLLNAAEQADEADVPLVARNLELWSHSTAIFHADLTGGPDPGTIVDYLEQVEDYDLPEGRRNEEV